MRVSLTWLVTLEDIFSSAFGASVTNLVASCLRLSLCQGTCTLAWRHSLMTLTVTTLTFSLVYPDQKKHKFILLICTLAFARLVTLTADLDCHYARARVPWHSDNLVESTLQFRSHVPWHSDNLMFSWLQFRSHVPWQRIKNVLNCAHHVQVFVVAIDAIVTVCSLMTALRTCIKAPHYL